jgi:cytochrome c oxidase subunit IV
MNEYLFWQQVITFAVIFSCVVTGFFYNRMNRSKISLMFALVPVSLLLLLFSFMFYESPIVGDS